MNIDVLASVLTVDHPTTNTPFDVDAKIAAGQMNVKNRFRNRKTMSGSEILNAITKEDWDSRTAEQRVMVWNIVHIGIINPFGIEATLIIEAFSGATGSTIADLAVIRQESISLATENNLSVVGAGHVLEARR